VLFVVILMNVILLNKLRFDQINYSERSGTRWQYGPKWYEIVKRLETAGPVVYVQKSDFHLINGFCVVIVVKKCIMFTPGSLLIFCTTQVHKGRYLWCLQPKLHICAACCSDSKMEL